MPEPEVVFPEAPTGEQPETESLPPLADSDPYVTATLDDLVGEAAVLRYFSTENIVQKAVATVDQKKTAVRPSNVALRWGFTGIPLPYSTAMG